MTNLRWTVTVVAAGSLVIAAGATVGWAQSAKSKKGKAAAGANLTALDSLRGDWPRWRGPKGDGLSAETGLLTEWPADGPPLAWRTKGLGGGFSSVAIAAGKIYTMGAGRRGEGGKNSIVCLNAADGAIEWSTAVGGGGAPNCTPTVDGDMVYGLSLGGDLACCKAGDGSLVWSKSYERDLGGHMMSSWGYSESVLVDGDKVICTPGGDAALLAALDKKTGDVIWKTAVPPMALGRQGQDGAGYASIVISNAGGVKQYVTLV